MCVCVSAFVCVLFYTYARVCDYSHAYLLDGNLTTKEADIRDIVFSVSDS